VAGLLARSQYPEGPATGHLDTGFSRFPCVYKQTLRRFPTFQVATTCFSCSPPDLNFLGPYFIFMFMHNNHCHRVTTQLQLNILLLYFYSAQCQKYKICVIFKTVTIIIIIIIIITIHISFITICGYYKFIYIL